MIKYPTETDEELSPPININKRPSYLEISLNQPSNYDFDQRVIRSLDVQLLEEEDDSEPIKTYLRIRPYSKASEEENGFIKVKDDKTVVATYEAPGYGLMGKKIIKNMEFQFTKVLDGSCSQENVFYESVAPLLDRFENGENCLVFSYGATNSGKTYTMRGSAKEYGIIPRTLDRIFTRFQDSICQSAEIQPFRHESTRALQAEQQHALFLKKKSLIDSANEMPEMMQRVFVNQQLQQSRDSDLSSHCMSVQLAGGAPPAFSRDPKTKSIVDGMWISFVELYNEKFYDLLAGPGKRKEVKIVTEKGGYAYWKDITELPVFSDEEAYALYVAGYKKLEIGSTQVNETSSRSHCFFTIRVVKLGVTKANTVYPISVHRMTFCDLAGCERLCQTENRNGQLKESANINHSLLSLLKVIRMIRDKQRDGYSGSFLEKIPFRDSKLTRIFQGYFTTSTHIAMIVNVNPTRKMIDSSVQTLSNSAIASNVIAFRPKPPPNTIVEDLLNNSSSLHSSLDLEDLIEETEPEDDDNGVQSTSCASETSQEELEIKMATPQTVLRQNNVNKSTTIKVDAKICATNLKNISTSKTATRKENISPDSDPSSLQSCFTYYSDVSAVEIENENLKYMLSQMKEKLNFKEQENKVLQRKVQTIEAQTREAMIQQLRTNQLFRNPVYQRPPEVGGNSDQRMNQFIRLPSYKFAEAGTQTDLSIFE